MKRKTLSKYLVSIIFLIFLVNLLANKLYWYSSIWYLDMIMHFLGGFWLGLLFLYFFTPQNISSKLIFKVFFFVFLVGTFWEVFEIFTYSITTLYPFDYLDTISDLCFDLMGGGMAIFYFFGRIMFKTENKV